MEEQMLVAPTSEDLRLSDFIKGEFVRWHEKGVEHFGIVAEINLGESQVLAVQGGNPFPTCFFYFATSEQRVRNKEVDLRKTTLGEFLIDSNTISRNYSDCSKKYNEVVDSLAVLLRAVNH
ncbi:MAG: hypothetical protein HYT98_03195 [Candidatus Sungbacteria bacterium]|nr:hypothetical protein [Candidatus Sungbacteria bacterium]